MSEIENDKLIACVLLRRGIWDKRIKEHANRNYLEKCWIEISAEMKVPVDKLRKKWKYLRDQFGNELSKIKRPRSGDPGGEIQKSTWQYFEQLLFLKDIVQSRQSSGNLTQFATQSSETAVLEPQTQQSFEESQEPTVQTEEERIIQGRQEEEDNIENRPHLKPPTPSQTMTHVHPVQGSSKKRARLDDFNTKMLDIEKRKVDLLANKIENKSSMEEDENILFFKSLLPHVKRIPAERMLSFRNSIQEIVQEYAYPSFIQGSSSFAASPVSVITFNTEYESISNIENEI